MRSAQSLVEDLSRFLEYKPIRARRMHALGTIGEVGPAAARDRGPAGDRFPDDSRRLRLEHLAVAKGRTGPSGTDRGQRNSASDALFQQARAGGARARREQSPARGPASGRMSQRATPSWEWNYLKRSRSRRQADYLSCGSSRSWTWCSAVMARCLATAHPDGMAIIHGRRPPARPSTHLSSPGKQVPRRRFQPRRLATRIEQLRRDDDLGLEDGQDDRQSQERSVAGGELPTEPRRPADRLGLLGGMTSQTMLS